MQTNANSAPDFWPGYVDALINVVLNLLFVVSIFAIAIATTGFTINKYARTANENAAAAASGTGTGTGAGAGAGAGTGTGAGTATGSGTQIVTTKQAATAGERATASTPTSTKHPSQLASEAAPADPGGVAERSGNEAGFSPSQLLNVRLIVHAAAGATVAPAVTIAPVTTGTSPGFKVTYTRGAVALDADAKQALQALATSTLADRQLTVWAATDLRQSGARQTVTQRVMTLRDELSNAGIDSARIDVRVTGGGIWPEASSGVVWLTTSEASTRTASTR